MRKFDGFFLANFGSLRVIGFSVPNWLGQGWRVFPGHTYFSLRVTAFSLPNRNYKLVLSKLANTCPKKLTGFSRPNSVLWVWRGFSLPNLCHETRRGFWKPNHNSTAKKWMIGSKADISINPQQARSTSKCDGVFENPITKKALW